MTIEDMIVTLKAQAQPADKIINNIKGMLSSKKNHEAASMSYDALVAVYGQDAIDAACARQREVNLAIAEERAASAPTFGRAL